MESLNMWTVEINERVLTTQFGLAVLCITELSETERDIIISVVPSPSDRNRRQGDHTEITEVLFKHEKTVRIVEHWNGLFWDGGSISILGNSPNSTGYRREQLALPDLAVSRVVGVDGLQRPLPASADLWYFLSPTVKFIFAHLDSQYRKEKLLDFT